MAVQAAISTSWWKGPIGTFDLETTGTDPEAARIVTAHYRIVNGGDMNVVLDWLVNPGVEIPEEAAKIHGITTEIAERDGRAAEEAIPEIVAAITAYPDIPLVIYNAGYDLTVTDREMDRYGLGALDIREVVIDPMVLDRHFDKWRKGSRKLIDTCRAYGVPLKEEEAHDAGFDALAAARLAYRMTQRIPEMQVALDELHRSQVKMRADWAVDFMRYLHRNGRGDEAATVRGDWPMVPRPQLALPISGVGL